MGLIGKFEVLNGLDRCGGFSYMDSDNRRVGKGLKGKDFHKARDAQNPKAREVKANRDGSFDLTGEDKAAAEQAGLTVRPWSEANRVEVGSQGSETETPEAKAKRKAEAKAEKEAKEAAEKAAAEAAARNQ